MATQILTTITILRRPDVQARTGLSRSAIYAGIKAGTFPPQIRLGPQTVGWLESDVQNFLAARVAESRSNTTGI